MRRKRLAGRVLAWDCPASSFGFGRGMAVFFSPKISCNWLFWYQKVPQTRMKCRGAICELSRFTDAHRLNLFDRLASFLISQQASIFIGLMSRTTSQVIDVVDADIWVMDKTNPIHG